MAQWVPCPQNSGSQQTQGSELLSALNDPVILELTEIQFPKIQLGLGKPGTNSVFKSIP